MIETAMPNDDALPQSYRGLLLVAGAWRQSGDAALEGLDLADRLPPDILRGCRRPGLGHR